MTDLLDPDNVYISISRSIQQHRQDYSRGGFDDFRKMVVAACRGATEMPDTREVHFWAKAIMHDEVYYFSCVSRAGSPSGKQRATTIISGIFREKEIKPFAGNGNKFTSLLFSLGILKKSDPK